MSKRGMSSKLAMEISSGIRMFNDFNFFSVSIANLLLAIKSASGLSACLKS